MQAGADVSTLAPNGHAPPPAAAGPDHPGAAQPAELGAAQNGANARGGPEALGGVPAAAGGPCAAGGALPAPGAPGAAVGAGCAPGAPGALGGAGHAPGAPAAPGLAQAQSQYSASPPAASEDAARASVVDVLSKDSVAARAQPLGQEPAAASAAAPAEKAGGPALPAAPQLRVLARRLRLVARPGRGASRGSWTPGGGVCCLRACSQGMLQGSAGDGHPTSRVRAGGGCAAWHEARAQPLGVRQPAGRRRGRRPQGQSAGGRDVPRVADPQARSAGPDICLSALHLSL
jgi:hypothetical protein